MTNTRRTNVQVTATLATAGWNRSEFESRARQLFAEDRARHTSTAALNAHNARTSF
jgi:hypothetical protein